MPADAPIVLLDQYSPDLHISLLKCRSTELSLLTEEVHDTVHDQELVRAVVNEARSQLMNCELLPSHESRQLHVRPTALRDQ